LVLGNNDDYDINYTNNNINNRVHNDNSNIDINKAKGSKKSRFVLFFFLIAAIMITAYMAYLKSNNMDFKKFLNVNFNKLISGVMAKHPSEMSDEEGVNVSEIKYETKDKPCFEIYKEWIIKVNNTW
jgi:anaerobic C4-dicarboxylate transporter